MKVKKGDVLTFRIRVDDAAQGSPLLGFLLGSMGGAPYYGLTVTASARGDVFAERDALLDEDGEAEAAARVPGEAFSRALANAKARVEPPAPSVPSVRVRIAVAVDQNGHAYGLGWIDSRSDEADMREQATENLLTSFDDATEVRVSWVEADVPLPAATTVKGSVSE